MSTGPFEPLRLPVFRRIWIGTTLSHAGGLIQGVGAAWLMASMASADYVAMVQTATFLPMAILALPAGAIADVYDRRRAQLLFFSLAMCAAALLTLVAFIGHLTPWLLLGLCSLVGVGGALAMPARGASVAEQVPREQLPRAVALNNISYNLARTVGPALGGLVVAAAGSAFAFLLNTLCFIPVLHSLKRWNRQSEESRLPPESLMRSLSAGVTYIVNMRPVRRAITRTFVTSLLVSVVHSLLPLVAKEMLRGDASTYGLLLGAYGLGAVVGVLSLHRLRGAIGSEQTVRLTGIVLALCLAVIAFSGSLWVDLPVLALAGAAAMIMSTTIAITIQMFVPRWVAGRAIATGSAATSLGIAGGSWVWGQVAAQSGLDQAFIVAAVLMVVQLLLGLVMPLEDREQSTESDPRVLADPDVRLPIGGRSGPVSVELEYRIDVASARDFYNTMRQIQKSRLRTGAYDWSISRDLADPELWSERFRCPTWHDYLRMRNRRTTDDAELFEQARALHIGPDPIRVRRWLDRPFGSVRWRDASPDRGDDELRIDG